MRARIWLAAVAVASLSAVAAAEDPAPAKGPWEGFGVGSSVTLKSTSAAPMPGMPETVVETKQTLVKVTDDEHVVKVETKVGEVFSNATEVKYPRKATESLTPGKPAVEDLGTETLTIEGKPYECAKKKVVVAGVTTVSWTHAKHGTLKFETTGAGGSATALAVTKLAAKVSVAGKEVECRETTTVHRQSGMEMAAVMLTCPSIPGGTARMETANKMGPMTMTTVLEAVAYEVK